MTDRLNHLENISRRLEAGPELRQKWFGLVKEYMEQFLYKTDHDPAYNPDNSRLHRLDEADLTLKGKPIEKLLDILSDTVDYSGINPASGGHLGYIPGGGLYPSALADYMVDITNRYAGIQFANPGAVKMENDLIRWMADIIGYPSSTLGNLASGGSIANLIAITTARDAKEIRSQLIPTSVIYLTEQTHHCVHKSLRIAGLGECILKEIPLDDSYRMDAQYFAEEVKKDKSKGLNPFLIVASLGSTDTGAIDPIDQLADICEEENIWFHLDAAYGGFFVLVESMTNKFKGIERSDSIVMDPHKTLFLPYGTGAVLVKEGKEILRSHYYRANYMQDAMSNATEVSPADLSPELTKHYRGLRMWLPLQLFGLEPFKAALEEKYLLTLYFYQKIQTLGFEVGPYPDLSVCIYRYIPKSGDANAFNKLLVSSIQTESGLFISSTTIDETYWIRIAVVCFRTHKHHIDQYLVFIENYLRREL